MGQSLFSTSAAQAHLAPVMRHRAVMVQIFKIQSAFSDELCFGRVKKPGIAVLAAEIAINSLPPDRANGKVAALYDEEQNFLILDVDLSPLPASATAEGSERGYLGRCRSKTGRKLVRLRAASTQEMVWETVVSGRTAENRPILQEAITQAEHVLGLDGEDEQTRANRARTEIREDARVGQ